MSVAHQLHMAGDHRPPLQRYRILSLRSSLCNPGHHEFCDLISYRFPAQSHLLCKSVFLEPSSSPGPWQLFYLPTKLFTQKILMGCYYYFILLVYMCPYH